MQFFLQIGLILIAIIVFLVAYSQIRQGGSRVYSLEREAVLRRASATMFVGVGILVLTIAWLYYLNPPPIFQPATEEEVAEADAAEIVATATPVIEEENFNQLPLIETVTPVPTIDPNLPTATPTPVVIRAFVIDTGGNGLYMREQPGGETVLILDENEFVTVLQQEGTQQFDGFTWVKVRTFLGDEGWVADVFLEIEGQGQ